MRIVAFSDTHQNAGLLRHCVSQAISDGRIDILVHCGDGVRDLEDMERLLLQSNPQMRIYAVRGNCDLSAFQYPATDTFTVLDTKIMLTHGHLFNVKHGLGKLAKEAKCLHANLAFFGHTHVPAVTEKHGVILLNPGSLGSNFENGTAYMETIVKNNQIIDTKFITNAPEFR